MENTMRPWVFHGFSIDFPSSCAEISEISEAPGSVASVAGSGASLYASVQYLHDHDHDHEKNML
jgi:hypothetical protein